MYAMVFDAPPGEGSGSALPIPLLVLAGLCTVFSVFVSFMSIYLHLKNYRKPMLQRMVIRIMLMVPIYGVASLISLFSLNAAFVIDAIRDIYEAFVIYCFFNLLLGYLGGERSLLILLHGREPKRSVFPVSLFRAEIDVSDPYMFLFLKRGIIQYVEVKPILAAATLILKAVGKYNEGNLRANSGYLYVSVVYNISICLSLYCLALFWMCINDDLKPFRPMPKFLCVKGILFFSFWQSFAISILVAAGAIRKLGPYTDSEHISLGLTDTMICLEMPLFAIAHMYAFSHTDYIDRKLMYAARMPMYYAFRDAFGLRDVIEDTKATLRGEGMDYRAFEPAEGFIHQGSGRERRIKAGLRYAKGGQQKYWLPMPAEVTERNGTTSRNIGGDSDDEEVYAPLMEDQADAVVHNARDLISPAQEKLLTEQRGFELPFGDVEEDDEQLYQQSRHLLFGDYHYPCIDASSEWARREMWDEEERVLRDERGAYFSPIRGAPGLLVGQKRMAAYGAMSQAPNMSRHSSGGSSVAFGVPANGKGKGRDGRPRVDSGSTPRVYVDDYRGGSPVIDKADLNMPAPEGGVRLGWTKDSRRLDSPRLSHSPALSASPRLREGRSNSSSIDRQVPPSPGSRATQSKQLPVDAVDLIVENEGAAEEENTRERRKGEPAVRGSGWRRAFTKGVFIPDSKVEDEGLQNVTEVEPTSEATDHPESENTETVVEVADLDVARSSTPPPHARVTVDRVVFPPNEENPWA